MDGEDEIIIRRTGPCGRITLNRPHALNAMTLPMVRAMAVALLDWRDDPDVTRVVVDGAGDRAFCAGADIRWLHAEGRAPGGGEAFEFFRAEYQLNLLIADYPKPYVALIDGVTMGGGAGVSLHGSHRVASERTLLAMPETAIGLHPDIGASWFLPRLPDRIGVWMGLTGARLDGAAARELGLATHFAPSDAFGGVITALEAGDDPESVLAPFAAPEEGALEAPRDTAAACFAGDTVEEIARRLDADGGDWAREQAEALAQRSPTSLKITMESLRRGAELDLAGCLAQELRLSARCLEGKDFYEGVRAQVIDKDRAPKWRPDTLSAVTEAMVAQYFAQLEPDREFAPLSTGGAG